MEHMRRFKRRPRGNGAARVLGSLSVVACVALGAQDPRAGPAADEPTLRAGPLGDQLDPDPPQQPPARSLRPGESPPAPYSCESIDLGSPDNQCAVWLEGHIGVIPPGPGGTDTPVVTEGTTLSLTCSSERGGFGKPLVSTHSATDRIGVRWIDAHTIEVGLPVDAHFTPPVERVDNLGETIAIRYVPVGAATKRGPPTLDCRESPTGDRSARHRRGRRKVPRLP